MASGNEYEVAMRYYLVLREDLLACDPISDMLQ
jgi:hypothetical protein